MSSTQVKILTGRFDEVHRSHARYFNDHCLIRHDDVWHFFGIVGPIGRSCYDEGSEVSFAHATSRDLLQWQECPDVLTVTGSGPDSHHVFAPHVLFKDGLFHMFYTGVDGKRRQRICLATSIDLFSWQRSDANPLIVPSLFWA